MYDLSHISIHQAFAQLVHWQKPEALATGSAAASFARALRVSDSERRHWQVAAATQPWRGAVLSAAAAVAGNEGMQRPLALQSQEALLLLVEAQRLRWRGLGIGTSRR